LVGGGNLSLCRLRRRRRSWRDGLDIFSEKSLGHHYSIAIRNKVAAILARADAIGIRKCRAAVKSGRPSRSIDQPALRMAA